ncbi:MAG: 4-hydroxyphenylacetate 3-hydroxylase N-terminal domain-containing protein [Pseudomonadota bacterium]
MRSPEQYMDMIKKRRLDLYHLGEKVTDMTEHPSLRWAAKGLADQYEFMADPKHEEILTAASPLIPQRTDRFLHVFGSVQDLLNRQAQIKLVMSKMGSCALKCPGLGGLNAIYSTSYDMDKKLGTSYHERAKQYLRKVQTENLIIAGMMMDVKGDRSKRPTQQDPDLYLHMVEERSDGIIVRGAKAHQTGPMLADELVIMPSFVCRDESEKDYAIAFAIPPETPGLTYVMQHNLADGFNMNAEGMDLGNVLYGCQYGATALVIFNDVFIPNDRIFMKGEWNYTRTLVTRMGTMARMWQCGCRPAIFDLLIGAVKLMAEYNGVDKEAHVIDKLTEMSILTETVWGLALASATNGKATPSGAFLPDPLLTNVAKLQSTRAFYELMKIAIDLTGGLIVTVPSMKDLHHPQVGPLLDKYFKGVAHVPTEHRLRIVRFIQALVGGPVAGALHHSGGPMQNQKIVIYRGVDFEEKKRHVKALAGISEEK